MVMTNRHTSAVLFLELFCAFLLRTHLPFMATLSGRNYNYLYLMSEETEAPRSYVTAKVTYLIRDKAGVSTWAD